jgi:DNA-binding MarR family transcriptional regulator
MSDIDLSEKSLKDLRERTESLMKLKRAPSQETVFSYLLETGRTMSVREISAVLELTDKAVERAVAKLVEKGLVQRSTFREGSYECDSRLVLMSLLRVVTQLYEDYENRS